MSVPGIYAPNRARDVIVLGAGVQGVCVALALATAGHHVAIVDRQPGCLLEASLHNEGKIHLGFVYANDPTGSSALLMLQSALCFGPLLQQWLDEEIDWPRLLARPFTYLILRDSMVSPGALLAAWHTLQGRYAIARTSTPISYLGTAPERLWTETAQPDPVGAFAGDRVIRAVPTAELAVDTAAFRLMLQGQLARSARVRCLFGHDVAAVRRVGTAFDVSGADADGRPWTLHGATVVNCLWSDRLTIDRQLGLVPRRPWVFRLKCRLLGQLPVRLHGLPSLTMMCGRFGDVVNLGNGRVYLSWYPSCLQGWSGDVGVPAGWRALMSGVAPRSVTAPIVAETLNAFDGIVPGLAATQVDSVAAGVIFSWGDTDIDDPRSELHRRDQIGPEQHEGYVTINTGKFTSAPLFARRVVDMLA